MPLALQDPWQKLHIAEESEVLRNENEKTRTTNKRSIGNFEILVFAESHFLIRLSQTLSRIYI